MHPPEFNGLAGLMEDRAALKERLAGCRAGGGKVVFTNGCFDLLHPGHLRLLSAARNLGSLLLVAINTDASVAKLKGAHRPLVDERSRAEMLLGLKPVNLVTFFSEPTPLELILALAPNIDVLVKGADYGSGAIVGETEVCGWGGRVERIALAPGFSTSAIEARIRAAAALEK